MSMISFRKQVSWDLKKIQGGMDFKKRNSRLNYSLASLLIIDDNYEDINNQIKEVESFLIQYKKQLTVIAMNKDIEYATIDFGVTSTTQYPNKAQSFYFPISLLTICAELKIGIELSTYSF
ncbi:hypothetical protein CKK33_06595 [Mucilaginibacter sp. MD40]|nr:hypothetical protein CKK33_06595 [Mucilaginibacter sp. MD40]